MWRDHLQLDVIAAKMEGGILLSQRIRAKKEATSECAEYRLSVHLNASTVIGHDHQRKMTETQGSVIN